MWNDRKDYHEQKLSPDMSHKKLPGFYSQTKSNNQNGNQSMHQSTKKIISGTEQ